MSAPPNDAPNGARPVPFCDPIKSPCPRLATLERLSEERWTRLDETLARIDRALDRIDRRMWLAASACAAAGLSALAAAAVAA